MELVAPERLSPLHIVFLDWTGRELHRIDKVPTELGGSCGYGAIEWIDTKRLAVECEYNPSLEEYVVFDADSGKALQEYRGLYPSWSPDHRLLAHVGPIVHFAPPSAQNYCLLSNDKPVYTRNCRSEVDPVSKPGTAPMASGTFVRLNTRSSGRPTDRKSHSLSMSTILFGTSRKTAKKPETFSTLAVSSPSFRSMAAQ